MNVLREKYDNAWLDIYIYIHIHTHIYTHRRASMRRNESSLFQGRDSRVYAISLRNGRPVNLHTFPFFPFVLNTSPLSLSLRFSQSLIAFVLHSLAVLFYADANDTRQFGNSN